MISNVHHEKFSFSLKPQWFFWLYAIIQKTKTKSKEKQGLLRNFYLQTTSKTGSHDRSDIRLGTILQHDNKVKDFNKAMFESQSCILKIFIRDKILFPWAVKKIYSLVTSNEMCMYKPLFFSWSHGHWMIFVPPRIRVKKCNSYQRVYGETLFFPSSSRSNTLAIC